MSRLWIVGAVFVLASCAGAMSNVVSPDLVQTRASADLDCPKESVKLQQLTDTNWKADGCGKSASYTCWTSVGMGDGTCLREP